MRNGEPGFVDLPSTIDQQVQIERTRAPAQLTLSSLHPLLSQQCVQQLARRQLGEQPGHSVDEGRLLYRADRWGVPQGRTRHQPRLRQAS